MPDLVRLRNVDPRKVALEVAVLDYRVVEPDGVIDIPAALLNHQRACGGTDLRFDPDTGTYSDGPCPGCLTWPAESWQVEAPAKTTTTTKDKG